MNYDTVILLARLPDYMKTDHLNTKAMDYW